MAGPREEANVKLQRSLDSIEVVELIDVGALEVASKSRFILESKTDM